MSQSHKGKTCSVEIRLKISASVKGKHHDSPSEETRRKMSRSLSGRKLSDEHRRKISLALKGNENARR